MRSTLLELEAERDVTAGAPAWVRPLAVACPQCGGVEPHSMVDGGSGWLMVCWGCDEIWVKAYA